MQRDGGGGGQDLLNQLPKIPDEVDGETNILLGIRYREYFPKLIFELKSGLGIFESMWGTRSPRRTTQRIFEN